MPSSSEVESTIKLEKARTSLSCVFLFGVTNFVVPDLFYSFYASPDMDVECVAQALSELLFQQGVSKQLEDVLKRHHWDGTNFDSLNIKQLTEDMQKAYATLEARVHSVCASSDFEFSLMTSD